MLDGVAWIFHGFLKASQGFSWVRAHFLAMVSGWHGYLLLRFHEETGQYSIRELMGYQDFSGFDTSDTFVPGEPMMFENWAIHDATVLDTNGALVGNSLRLGGASASGGPSYVQSPAFFGMISGVSFWYRNLDETGTRAGNLKIQATSSDDMVWDTIAVITNIVTVDDRFFRVQRAFLYHGRMTHFRVVWEPEDNPGYPSIALDDLIIEDLRVDMYVPEITVTPEEPVFTDSVSVSAVITPYPAWNMVATAWYRPGTSGVFHAASMIQTIGNSWITDPPLPRLTPGIVQHYIETAITTPHGEGPYQLTVPPQDIAEPLVLSNQNTFAAFSNFTADEGWLPGISPSNQATIAGWSVNDAMIRNTNFVQVIAHAAWLSPFYGDASSYVQTPWLEDGVGVVQVSSVVRMTGPAEFEIQMSTNLVDWESVATVVETNTVFTTRIIPLNIHGGVSLRLVCVSAYSPGTPLGLDYIRITYPLADVVITNVLTHPAYPYQVEVGFEGGGAASKSPKRFAEFVTPDHYWPVDLNRETVNTTPYYFSFSSLPGYVWINAFNTIDAATTNRFPDGQFVEIVGRAGINIGNWRLESIMPDFRTNASYRIEDDTILGAQTNGFGFFVFGQADIAVRNRDLTNGLPHGGGLQLIRGMGAIEQQLAYDVYYGNEGYQMIWSPDHRYIHVGLDDQHYDAALAMTGSGGHRDDFTWQLEPDGTTSIGTVNTGQTIIPWGEYVLPIVPVIQRAWLHNGRLYMEFPEASLPQAPIILFKASLMDPEWLPVAGPEVTVSEGLSTASCALEPGGSTGFYKISSDGE